VLRAWRIVRTQGDVRAAARFSRHADIRTLTAPSHRFPPFPAPSLEPVSVGPHPVDLGNWVFILVNKLDGASGISLRVSIAYYPARSHDGAP
jgi:hypothetical protein